MRNDVPVFPGVRKPLSDFRAVKTDLQTQPLIYEVDLSTSRSIAANTALVLRFAGNSLYVDKAPDVGNGYLIFQDDSQLRPTKIYAQPGFIARTPWTQLIVENAAQAGKVLRIIYGVDIDFTPGTSSDVLITGTVDTDEQPFTYGASFSSSAALAAGVAETVFTPAANVNGAQLWACDFYSYLAAAATPKRAAVIAHTSAPANITTGAPIGFSYDSAGTPGSSNMSMVFRLAKPVLIPAGRGLYFVCECADNGYRRALYTLL